MVDKKLIANNLILLLYKYYKKDFTSNYYDKVRQKNNFNFIVDKICDNNILGLLYITSEELYILRIVLGFYNNGMADNQQESYIFKNYKMKVIRIINKIVKFILEFNFFYNKSKISSLMIYNTCKNFSIIDLEMAFNLKKKLLDSNINTIHDLLSYSRFDFKIMGYSELTIKNIYDFAHSLGLKFLDELSFKEKSQLLKNSNLNTILESSVTLLSDIINIEDVIKLFKINGNITIGSIINLPLTNEEIEKIEKNGIPIKFLKGKQFLINLIRKYIDKKSINFYINYNSIELDEIVKLIINSDIESLFIITPEELKKLRQYLNDYNNNINNDIFDELFDMETIILKLIGIIKKGINNFPKDNKNRMSSLSLFNNYHNFSLQALPLNIKIIIELQENGINTLYDLLSYSLNDLKNIIDNLKNLNIIINVIHLLNLKFIDELSDKEKQLIIGLNKNHTEVILNSSLSFLPYHLFSKHIPKNEYYKNFFIFYHSRPNKFSIKFISLIEKYAIPISYCNKNKSK